MFVRFAFWLMLILFVTDIAQPGYLKFWQPDLSKLSTIDIGLPFLKFNNTARISPRKISNCPPPDNDLEEVLQAKFGCHNATPN